MTAPHAICSGCGRPLPPDALGGICPRCLLGVLDQDNSSGTAYSTVLANLSTDETPLADSTLRQFGDYELLEEIARGGMGVVYKARQLKLNRVVAVKMIFSGRFAGKSSVQRFRGEAAAAGVLQHPNIVAIHEIGMHEGQHFFSMDYVEGQNLAQLVGTRPLAALKAAGYAKLIAQAIHYAHEQGILHRDLKPSNVLIETATDQPRVTDFGLAKWLEGESSLTLSGQALGSPNFMPPEQATGSRGGVSRQSDVYGLGGILYFLLTARAPFQGDTIEATIHQTVHVEPVAPRLLNSSVPPDLQTICLKCLDKDPAKRYATAEQLAEELDRFLNGKPVHARPIGPTARWWRWCRRNPTLATLGALVLVLLLAVVVGAPIAIVRIDRARADAERRSYSSDMRLASEALRKAQVGEVKELLNLHQPGKGVEDLSGFEWRYLRHAANQSALVTRQLSGLTPKHFLVNPRLVAAGNTLYNHLEETGQILAWDMTTWLPISLKLPSNRASERWWWYLREQAALAVNDKERTIAVYRLPSLKEVSVIAVPGAASQTAVGPDLRTIAIGFQDGDVHRILVWDLAANARRGIFGEYPAEVIGLAFSPDGKVLMAACADGEIGLWSITQGKGLPSPTRDGWNTNEDRSSPPFFGPGSTRLFFKRGHEGNALEVWDWSTGKATIAYQTRLGRLDAFDFSPDGALLACVFSGEDGVLLDTKDFGRIGAIPANGARILDVVFSPSGQLIASVSRTSKLWDVKTQRELATLGDASGVLFTPDESSVLTAGSDGKITVWNLRALLRQSVVWHSTNTINAFAVSADDHAIATVDSVGGVHVWDLARGGEIGRVQTGGETAIELLFSPSEHVLAWTGSTTLGILNYDSGQTNTYPIPGGVGHWRPAFTADGRELAFAAATNIMILDMATRKARPFARIKNPILGLAYSTNGLLLATADSGGDVTLWDRVMGRAITSCLAHKPMAFEVDFSPDGRLLASGGADGNGKLWELVPGGLKLLCTLRGHVGAVEVFFLPDGRRLVSYGGGDNGLKLWDTRTGLEVGTLFGNGGTFAGVGRSRDGNTIYYATEEGDVRFWEAPQLNGLLAPGSEKSSKNGELHPNVRNN